MSSLNKFTDKKTGISYDFEDTVARQSIEELQAQVGGGLAVTGASVGQTIKIAAVDENGAPTAWEAVEFPAEEEYELIQEVVSDGTVSAIKVEQWADGTPLNAKKIRILTSAPKNDTTVNVVYYAYFNKGSAALISTLLANNSKYIFGKYEYIKKRDYWRVYKAEAQTLNPSTHGAYFGTIMETSPSMMNEYTTAERNIITKVTAGGVNGAQFPDGTIFKFYGVKA